MSSQEESEKERKYTLRSSSSKRKHNSSDSSQSSNDSDDSNSDNLFTEHGYLNDGFVINDEPITDRWKQNIPKKDIKRLEPELKKIRSIIESEMPTMAKILDANITLEDKKKCVRLFDQLGNVYQYTDEYNNIVENINNIIMKGNNYTKKEIERLEQIECNLRKIASPEDTLKNQILNLNANNNVKAILYGQYLELQNHEIGSQSYNAIREEIEWGVKLPHNNGIISNIDPKDYHLFMEGLNKELYALNKVKLRMLHVINDRQTSGGACGRNIAFVGVPGAGKTAAGIALAKVAGVPYEKISVGGLRDAGILTGNAKVWVSSGPSIVLQILSRLKSSTAVVIFDELDKLAETPEGKEIQFALLSISDYVHNKEFQDSYLNKYPHDLSKVLFIYIMNKTDGIDPALLSRLDIIYVDPYTDEEKFHITKSYVLPRALETLGMKRTDVIISDDGIRKLVTKISDPGVRMIEKVIKSLVGKINMYRSVVLKDGTTGDLQLGYKIPNFKLPLKIDTKLLVTLVNDVIDI